MTLNLSVVDDFDTFVAILMWVLISIGVGFLGFCQLVAFGVSFAEIKMRLIRRV